MGPFSDTPLHLLITGSLLAFLSLLFLGAFLLRGGLYWLKLGKIVNAIEQLGREEKIQSLKTIFSKDERLAHLWSEFSESLHLQREEVDGQMTTVAVRSTMPAETYFNTQTIVDSRLYTEFFKHLPGIFTGLGIIGTFGGLIAGLKNFQVSENAATVRASLEALMVSVGEAFIISAVAIAAAMLITFCEKWLLAALHKRAEEIAHRIDEHFVGGAGEDYLSRLVSASEASATQSKILKDALVRELGDILREVSALQLQTAKQENQALGGIIAKSIQESLQGPLAEIAGAVKQASSDQSSSAIQMLNDVMVSFSQRLNDLFGGQINGINELNKQSAQSMKDAAAALSALIAKLETSSRQATDDMAAAMMESVKAMEDRQATINAQTQAFVDQIREVVENSQAASQGKLQGALEAIGSQMSQILADLGASQAKVFQDNRDREKAMSERMSELVTQLVARMDEGMASFDGRQANIQAKTEQFVGELRQISQDSQTVAQQKLEATLHAAGNHMSELLQRLSESQTKAFEENQQREEAMANRASGLVGKMSESIESAVKEMADASRNMAQSVTALSTATSQSIEKMNAGADRLGAAASNFATAGDRMNHVFSQIGVVTGKLGELSGQLTSSVGSLQDVLRDYQLQRQAMIALMAEVRGAIEAARKDVSITSDVLRRIEVSAEKLASAQRAADEYLSGINDVLADSTEAFRTSVVTTLGQVNQDFHTKLANAVKLLSGAIQELQTSLDSFAPQG